MKELPNGVKIFNGTPHVIRFWDESWDEPVEVEPDDLVNANIVEYEHKWTQSPKVTMVSVEFAGNKEGLDVLNSVPNDVLVIGSLVAAQAYPGRVFAMVPCKGYERVPPAKKRMRPDKFTTF